MRVRTTRQECQLKPGPYLALHERRLASNGVLLFHVPRPNVTPVYPHLSPHQPQR